MNGMVDKLLDVDNRAKSILDSAKQYQERTIQEIGEEKQKIRSQYQDSIRETVERMSRASGSMTEDATGEIRERYDQLTAALEDTYQQNSAQWQEILLQKCLGR